MHVSRCWINGNVQQLNQHNRQVGQLVLMEIVHSIDRDQVIMKSHCCSLQSPQVELMQTLETEGAHFKVIRLACLDLLNDDRATKFTLVTLHLRLKTLN